jgi:amino acid adenylation domain-containing protein
VRQYFVDATTPIGARVPIGYPVEDMTVRVIDAEGNETQPGEIGEIVVESRYLALGYWQRPDLTAARFTDSPRGSGLRRYRTGDLGRLAADGCLGHLGRTDFQPKIRGHRVDVAEVEAALRAIPAISEAIVLVRDDGDGEARLVAYCVARDDAPPSARALREQLEVRLPRELLPAAYVWLDRLPLSETGKLDRAALPPPGRARPALETGFAAARNDVERELARLMAEALRLDEVGIDDSFFDLGGDSLQGTRLMARIRARFGVEPGLRALFETPTVAGLAAAINAQRAATIEAAARRTIARRADRESGPLSFAQERMLFESRLAPGLPLFNVPVAMRLVGRFDAQALIQALHGIAQRHPALRTTIPADGAAPMQRIATSAQVEMANVDLTPLAAEHREAALRERLVAETRRGFDLAKHPPWRVALIRLAENEHVLLLVLHHIIDDGWSAAMIVGELSARYEAALRGRALELPALAIDHADYAAWQRARLRGERQLAYWRRKLDGAPPFLDLELGRPTMTAVTSVGARAYLDLPEALVTALTGFAQRSRSTPFIAMLAAFKALIARYIASDDIVVGTAISGRDEPETQDLAGCFINILAMRTDLAGDPSFRELVARVRETVLEAHANQDLPFEALVAQLRPERRAGRQPLAQLAFILEPEVPTLSPATLRGERIDVDVGISIFDLALFVEPRGTGMRAIAEYRTELFDAPAIARLLAHWRRLLEGAIDDPGRRLSELPLLSLEERTRQLIEWNATTAAYPSERCIHTLFEAQAANSPDALELGAQRLSYRALDQRANAIARQLRRAGVGPDVLVGLCLERSFELVAAIFGILKAGGAFVPLDPSYPADRLAFMLADARAPVVLTHTRLLDRLPVHAGRMICLDREASALAADAGDDSPGAATASSLAYVIYTSGSTGRPKGVMIEHRALVNYIAWMRGAFAFEAHDAVLQKAPVSFDAAMWEIFLPLCAGARLVLAPPDAERDPARIVALLRAHDVTTVQFVPTLLRLIVDEPALAQCTALTRVFCGGEALPSEAARRFLARSGARLFNLYGPTETCIYSLAWECRRDDTEAIAPIGRPTANTRAYVLDAHRQLLPVGAAGELHLGGDGLARGYWNRPELTAASFLPDPRAPIAGARMYRTGDRARLRPDGVFEFLGRVDQQVKLRGHRIEPGEIEAALAAHETVRAAAVVLREDVEGDPRLVAYVVPRGNAPDASSLRAALARRLPPFMIPAAFVVLDALPRTPSGKIDRRLLPAPDATTPTVAADADAAERDEQHDAIEVQLMHVWSDLLGHAAVGGGDDFFALGGHSLLALQLIDRVNRLFDRELPVDALWHGGRTIAGLAALLRDAAHDRPPLWRQAVPIKPGGSRPPLFCTPAIGGHLYFYESLARHVDDAQPIYGLPAQGIDRREPPHTTIAAMAAHAIALMRAVQPRGPYRLLGFCSAGVVAFEMARQLEAAGETVARLVLADSAPPGTYFRLWGELLPAALRGKQLRLLQERLYHLALHRAGLERLREFRKAGEAHRWALMGYRPGPIDSRATLIRSVDGLRAREPACGWARFLRDGVDVHALSCRHEEMFAAKTVAQLAAVLRL